jgi:signal transduction histidine kinase
MTLPVLSMPLETEHDLVAARQRAREVSRLLGFGAQDQIRIATAVSEIARNALRYAVQGRVMFEVADKPEAADRGSADLVVRVSDRGAGIPHLDEVLSGQYQSSTGMGLGLVGAFRLMDSCDIQSRPGEGTVVTLKKALPAGAAVPGRRQIAEMAAQLDVARESSSFDELQRQNGELVATLNTLRERQDELAHMADELEDTNRGVMALYAELDQQAEQLRRADEMKSRFLSNTSHEFRTPLSSIRALAKLLLTEVDGALSVEQRKQIGFIASAAHELSDLVNDLLDLAKIEAGKVVVRPTAFEVADLFSALRGMFNPVLLSNDQTELLIEEPRGIPAVFGDEPKVSQILRNLISNALKFTPSGRVTVSCALVDAENDGSPQIEFSVRDTGIGIATSHLTVVFEEFSQVEHKLQLTHKGTGLGLPLCKKLAALLNGSIRVTSELGMGSCFVFSMPVLAGRSLDGTAAAPSSDTPDSSREMREPT